jgi:hypothetical protein
MKRRTAITLFSLLLILSCKKKEEEPLWHWSQGGQNFNVAPHLTNWANWGDTLHVVTFYDANISNTTIRLAFKTKPDVAKQYKVVANPKANDEMAIFMDYYYADLDQYINVAPESGHLHFSSQHFKTSFYNNFGPTLSWTSNYEGTMELSDATQ